MTAKICTKKFLKKIHEFVIVSRAVTVEILHWTKRGLHGLKSSMTVTDSFCTIENSKELWTPTCRTTKAKRLYSMPHYIFIFYFPLYRRKRWLCRSEILLQGCSRPYLVSARGQFLHNLLYGEVVGSRICWAKTCNSGRQRKVYWNKRNNKLNDHSFAKTSKN